MSQAASIRQQQQSWGRRALGLFAAVWLNLALQPCAMAYEAAGEHDCPHCPPAHTQEHGDRHTGIDHDVPCADAVPDCNIDDDWNHDSRGGQFKLKDTPGDLPTAIAQREFALALYRPAVTRTHPAHASAHAGASPPLHVLNCVYLK